MAISRWIAAIHQPANGGWRYKVLDNTINYILNPDKTDGGLLTGSFNCSLAHALDDMIKTKKAYGQVRNDSHDRLGYHFLVSFSPEENVPDELAYQIVREFIKRWLGDGYECVFGIHNDKGHKHGHICLNSVNIHTGRKFRYEDGDWAEKIQPLLDEICREHGVHTLEIDTGMNPADWKESQEQKKKKAGRRKRAKEKGKAGRNEYYNETLAEFNKNDLIRFDIDDIILHVSSYEEFLEELQKRGYKIKFGTSAEFSDTLSLFVPGAERFRRMHKLGKEYTVAMIKERIQAVNKPLPVFDAFSQVRLAVPYSFFRVRSYGVRKTQYNRALKMYYAKLYRLGVKPRSAKSNYVDCKQRLAEIKDYQEKIYIVSSNHAFDPTSTTKALQEQYSRIDEIDEKLDKAYGERLPYKRMISDYNQWKKLVKLSAPTVEQVTKRHNLKKKLQMYPFSMEEIERFVSEGYKGIRDLKKQKREIAKVVSVLEEVSGMYDSDTMEYETDYNAYDQLSSKLEQQEDKNTNRKKKNL